MVHNSQTFPVSYPKPAPLKQHTKIPSQESICLTGARWSQPLSSIQTSNRTEASVARIPQGSCCRSTSLVPVSLSCSNLCPNETTPCFVCVGAVDRQSHWCDLCMHKTYTVCQSKALRDSKILQVLVTLKTKRTNRQFPISAIFVKWKWTWLNVTCCDDVGSM